MIKPIFHTQSLFLGVLVKEMQNLIREYKKDLPIKWV